MLTPTVVYIHDGAFNTGPFQSGSTEEHMYHGAELSAHNNVVVVTINYRVGIFGI